MAAAIAEKGVLRLERLAKCAGIFRNSIHAIKVGRRSEYTIRRTCLLLFGIWVSDAPSLQVNSELYGDALNPVTATFHARTSNSVDYGSLRLSQKPACLRCIET